MILRIIKQVSKIIIFSVMMTSIINYDKLIINYI